MQKKSYCTALARSGMAALVAKIQLASLLLYKFPFEVLTSTKW